MKRTTLLALLLSTLIVTLAISRIAPAKAYTYSHSWIGQSHYDPFWGTTLTVFQEFSTAIATITVRNNGPYDLNVSEVTIGMDWGNNYSSTECSAASPVVISPGEQYRTFTVTFNVPATSVASNLYRHYYTIYVYEVNATSGPQEVNLHDMDSYSGFTVYSTTQKNAMKLRDEISLLSEIYDGSPWNYPDWMDSIDARSLWENYTIHHDTGDHDYDAGHFDSAETHYETALDLLQQAISTELAYDLEEHQYQDSYDRQIDSLDILQRQANIANTSATANATLRTADATYALAQAAMTQAYAWIVFGIGFVVFGIAAVVWANKRPGPQP